MKNKLIKTITTCSVCVAVSASVVPTVVALEEKEMMVFDQDITIENYASPAPSVTVNGVNVAFANGASAFLMDSRTMIPVRGVFEQMGYTVTWEDNVWADQYESDAELLENYGTSDPALVTISSGTNLLQSTITITLNNKIMQNGVEVQSDVAPLMVSGNYYLPLRAIAEATGADVDWDEPAWTATIEFVAQPVTVTPPTTATGSVVGQGTDYVGEFGDMSVTTWESMYNTWLGMEYGDARTAYEKTLRERTNYSHDILYANAPADNPDGVPEGAYFFSDSNTFLGADSNGDIVSGESTRGMVTLNSGLEIYIGESQESIIAKFGQPTGTYENNEFGTTYKYDNEHGFHVAYTDSGRVTMINVVHGAVNDYANKGLSYGSGDFALGDYVPDGGAEWGVWMDEHRGAGESIQASSNITGATVTIDGVEINYLVGLSTNLNQVIAFTIRAYGLA